MRVDSRKALLGVKVLGPVLMARLFKKLTKSASFIVFLFLYLFFGVLVLLMLLGLPIWVIGHVIQGLGHHGCL
jgi:hypothetical protein